MAAFTVCADNVASLELHRRLGYEIAGFHREFLVEL